MKSAGLITICSFLSTIFTPHVLAAAVAPVVVIVPSSALVAPVLLIPASNPPSVPMFPAAAGGPILAPPMFPTAAAGPILPPPMAPVAALPVAPAEAPPVCLCNGVARPVLAGDLCVCGDCKNIKAAIDSYTEMCPDNKFSEFNKGIAANCKGIENTEDCEFFKQSPGDITDAYKKCRDDLDSIHDDCENCDTDCSIVGKKEEEKGKDD